MQSVALVGGPKPYCEAMRARFERDEIVVIDLTTSDMQSGRCTAEHADVVLQYCRDNDDWDALAELSERPAVAVLPELEVGQFVRALASGSGAVCIDTSTEIIAAVAQAAMQGESLLPMRVAQEVALLARNTEAPRALNRSEAAIAEALLEDLTIMEMADRFHFSDRTIRRRLQGLYLKLGATNRTTAIEVLRA